MKRLALLALLAPLCLTAPASAGLRSTGTVVIDLAARRVSANVGNTYNSSNGTESMQCEITAYATTSSIRCSARNTAGVMAACVYVNPPPAMIAAVGAIGPDTNVHFTWSTTGQCTYVTVFNGSTTDTKSPPSNQLVLAP